MKLELVQGNIVQQTTDAIVNAANTRLLGGGGVDGAIHRAGGPTIMAECQQWIARHGKLPVGQAMATGGGLLPVKWVVHTVGPFYEDGQHGEPEALASCYRESLRLCDELGARSVAFPSISTGAYCYPLDEAAEVSLRAVREARTRVALVRFVLFDAEALAAFQQAAARS